MPVDCPYPPAKHPLGRHFRWEAGRVIDAFQFVYLTEGQGILETRERGRIVLGAGDVFFLFPGVWHRYAPLPGTGWNEHWFELRGPWIDGLIQSGSLPAARPVVRPGRVPSIISQFDSLHGYARHADQRIRGVMAAAAMLIVELALYHVARPDSGSRTEQTVREFISRLTETYDTATSIRQIARDMHRQETYLRRTFKKQMGMTPKRYSLLLRLRKGSELLLGTPLPVHQIAEQLGFYSAAHFSTAFKKEFSLAPNHWRARGPGAPGSM